MSRVENHPQTGSSLLFQNNNEGLLEIVAWTQLRCELEIYKDEYEEI